MNFVLNEKKTFKSSHKKTFPYTISENALEMDHKVYFENGYEFINIEVDLISEFKDVDRFIS